MTMQSWDVDENGNVCIRGYCATDAEVAVLKADLSELRYSVYGPDDVAVSGHSNVSLTIPNVWFDTVVTQVTDAGWPYTSQGYNFLHRVLHTAFATPGRHYYELKKTFTAGGQHVDRWTLNVQPRLLT